MDGSPMSHFKVWTLNSTPVVVVEESPVQAALLYAQHMNVHTQKIDVERFVEKKTYIKREATRERKVTEIISHRTRFQPILTRGGWTVEWFAEYSLNLGEEEQ